MADKKTTEKKITEITPEQAARFPEWVDKWTKIGLSTEPADFTTAKAAVLDAYRESELAAPKIVMTAPSPLATSVQGAAGVIFLDERNRTVLSATEIKAIRAKLKEKGFTKKLTDAQLSEMNAMIMKDHCTY